MIWEIATAKDAQHESCSLYAFEMEMEMIENNKVEFTCPRWHELSSPFKNLADLMLNFDPACRVITCEILHHSLLNSTQHSKNGSLLLSATQLHQPSGVQTMASCILERRLEHI